MAGPVWLPDILGDGFDQLELPLKPDDEGPVSATLVRYRARPRIRFTAGAAQGANVLYLHGWSDYFFQVHLAEYWHSQGAHFYALDLRKYGRSLRPGQTPGQITDLATYDEDIAAALEVMGSDRPLVLMGHSTGGLTASLWAARHKGEVAALVLNAPWLEFQGREFGRAALAPMVGLRARSHPLAELPAIDLGFYTRAVSSAFDGEWHYRDDWRPVHGFTLRVGWLNAILAGHAKVATGLGLEIPVLVLLSAQSTLAGRWSEAMLESDSAIDVHVVAIRALRLGAVVTVARLQGALHDVFLSKPVIRKRAFGELTRWLRGYLR